MSIHPRDYSVAGSEGYVLADGILIFRQGWKDAINNPKPRFSGKPLNP
jgi:hypothetical protein